MKTCLSTDQLEVDVDASSDVSSELSFGYEFAQAEVMMKGMGNNGKCSKINIIDERCVWWSFRLSVFKENDSLSFSIFTLPAKCRFFCTGVMRQKKQ